MRATYCRYGSSAVTRLELACWGRIGRNCHGPVRSAADGGPEHPAVGDSRRITAIAACTVVSG